MSSVITSLPELVKMIDIYRNNPYILCRYRGIDWKNYASYNTNKFNSFNLCNNLYLISCMSGQHYKIDNNDFIKVLDGCIYLNGARKLCQEEFLLYESSFFGLCKGKSIYSTFLHYKNQ
jgi:hypothetical protein